MAKVRRASLAMGVLCVIGLAWAWWQYIEDGGGA